jgi:hypothetical protein
MKTKKYKKVIEGYGSPSILEFPELHNWETYLSKEKRRMTDLKYRITVEQIDE